MTSNCDPGSRRRRGRRGLLTSRHVGRRSSRCDVFRGRACRARRRSRPASKGLGWVPQHPKLAEAAALFEKRLFYTLDGRGAVQQVADSSDVDLQIPSMTRSIAAIAQVVVEPGRDQWQTTERDNVGTYVAAYESPAPHKLHKRKLRYTQLGPGAATVGTGGAGIDIAGSEIAIELRADGFLLHLDATEADQATGSTLASFVTTAHYRLAYVGTGRLGDDVLAQAQATAPKPSDDPNTYKRSGDIRRRPTGHASRGAATEA